MNSAGIEFRAVTRKFKLGEGKKEKEYSVSFRVELFGVKKPKYKTKILKITSDGVEIDQLGKEAAIAIKYANALIRMDLITYVDIQNGR